MSGQDLPVRLHRSRLASQHESSRLMRSPAPLRLPRRRLGIGNQLLNGGHEGFVTAYYAEYVAATHQL